MDAVFLKILNMSIAASYTVLAAILLRLVLKKAPKWIHVVLWGLVALRLMIPVSIESTLSLIPSAETVPLDFSMKGRPAIDSGIPAMNHLVNPILERSLTPAVGDSANPAQIWLFLLENLWVCGMVGMLVYALVSYLRIRYRVREAVRLKENIWVCDKIATPFLLGLFRPRIYLPVGMAEGDADYVIVHERAHLKRRDHIWKPLGFLLLAVHWFNPALWAAYILLCRDIELACDERVLRELGAEAKKPYSQALINCSLPRRQIAACPLAFGEVGVRARVKEILHYKKPAFWVLTVAAVLLTVTAVCLLTDPVDGTLRKIENRDFSQTARNTVLLRIGDHGEYWYSESFWDTDMEALMDLRISHGEVSQSRGKDRDVTYTVELLTRSKRESGNVGTAVHFSEDFSEVWVDDNVKPTLSYRVLDPEKAEEVFRYVGGKGVQNLAPISSAAYITRDYYFSGEKDSAFLSLSGLDNTCSLSLSLLSSYFPHGTYVENDEALVMTGERGEKYVFRKEGEDLIFDAAASVELPSFRYSPGGEPEPCFPDGAVFERKYMLNGREIDRVDYDLDADGRKETCILSYGPTSGIFTFCLAVTEDEKPEYCGFYISGFYHLRFVERDGELKIQGITQGENPETHYFDISLRDTTVWLTENQALAQLPSTAE